MQCIIKPVLLLIFCFLLSFASDAQFLSWFHGDWAGETYFPKGPITKRIVVKLRVIKIIGDHFEAMLDNFYPNDTTIRLERKITGRLFNKTMQIESSEQTYIRDPRTQNFWRDCSDCDIQPVFSISDSKIEIQIKTVNCGDECDGETSFSRDTSTLDNQQKNDLAKWFHLPSPKPATSNQIKLAEDSSKTAPEIATVAAKSKGLPKQAVAIKDSASDHKKADIANKNTTDNTQQKIHKFSTPTEVSKDSSKIQKPPAANTEASQKPAGNPLLTEAAKTMKQDSLSAIQKADTVPSALSTRTTNLITTYQVMSSHIVVQLFDNAEIDGDIVTVYHNGTLIANRQSLTHKAITIIIDASKTNAHHEFIMVADNLGLIPPNTALMRITAGQQKFELEVSSDFENNSKIAIDYTVE